MWIFDEILPKSQSSTKSGGSTGGTQDPIGTQPIVISESESIVTSNDILENIEKQPEEVTKVEESTSVLIEETPESILDEIDNKQDIITVLSSDSSDLEKAESIFASSDSDNTTSPFFDMMSKETPTEEVNFSNLAVSSSDTSFQDTNEYIDHALVGVNTLMENLEKADAKKLAEEDEYTHQKEHFTELAIQAEEEHQKILAEKAHAEKVKAYLEQEKIQNNQHEDISSTTEASPLPEVLDLPAWETQVEEEIKNTLDADITALLTESEVQEEKKESNEAVAA